MGENSPKLLFMTHEFSPHWGGIATYVEGMAKAAAEKNIEVEVWSHGEEKVNEMPFKVVRMGTQGNQGWSDRLRLASALRSLENDWSNTILCLPEPGPLRLWLYQRVLGLPEPKAIIPIFHGSEINLLQRWPYRRMLFDRFLRSADRIGVVSEYVRSLLLEEDNHLKKISVVPGAPLLMDAKVNKKSNRRRLNSQPLRLLCLGRIQKRKGQLDLIRAFEQIPASKRLDFDLVFVGRIKDRGYLREILKLSRKLELNLDIQGEVNDAELNHILKASDLLVFPSQQDDYRVEGLGLVVLEAAIQEIPALGSQHGGIPEAIVNGETGWICDTRNSAKFAQMLMDIQSSPEQCHQFGEQAKKWVQENFSYTKNLRKLFREWYPQI